MELKCNVQNYLWGKKGLQSAAARLSQGLEVSETTPYAELWMGTHPSGPSVLKKEDQSLEVYLQSNPAVLGPTLVPGQLAFLFKVLSIDQALSVQAHPSKSHAEFLHAKFPDVYKDPNHKPELAVALTNFEALCGFRPSDEIQFFLRNMTEWQFVINSDHIAAFIENPTKECLKTCFSDLMSAKQESVQLTLDSVLKRVGALAECEKDHYEGNIVEDLTLQFPGDVGILCVYFLNHMRLSPGQALYLGPNEPHAYLKGDVVECMANSDNVVRAGLTPKFRDVETLCGMLTYQNHHPKDIIFPSEQLDANTRIWRPPMPDFVVSETKLKADESYTLPVRAVVSILLVVEGQGCLNETNVREGSIMLISACHACNMKAETSIVMFQSFCNL